MMIESIEFISFQILVPLSGIDGSRVHEHLPLTFKNRCFGDKGDVEDITEGMIENISHDVVCFFHLISSCSGTQHYDIDFYIQI